MLPLLLLICFIEMYVGSTKSWDWVGTRKRIVLNIWDTGFPNFFKEKSGSQEKAFGNADPYRQAGKEVWIIPNSGYKKNSRGEETGGLIFCMLFTYSMQVIEI